MKIVRQFKTASEAATQVATIDEFINSRHAVRLVIQPKTDLGSVEADCFYPDLYKDGLYDFGRLAKRSLYIPETSLYKFRDVFVSVPHGYIVFNDGKILAESSGHHMFRGTQYLEECAIKLPGQFGMFASNNFRNYSHWHVECLPSFVEIARALKNSKVKMISPALDLSFHRPSLHAFGFDIFDELRCENGHFHLDELIWSSSYAHSRAPEATWTKTLELVTKRLLSLATKDPSSVVHGDLVYVSRKDSPKRVLENEDELISRLQEIGFEIFDSRQGDYFSHIRAFANAKLILGPHGAGMTNLIFASKGARVIEIMPPALSSSSFFRLCPLFGLKYAFFKQVDENISSKDETWSLCIDQFMNFLYLQLP